MCVCVFFNVVPSARIPRLSGCNLSERSCEALAPLLSSSRLKELDLSNNNLHDSGLKLLSAGLRSPQCSLDTLRSEPSDLHLLASDQC